MQLLFCCMILPRDAFGQQGPGCDSDITVSGVLCHPEYATSFALQPALLNGKCHYLGASRLVHLYWSPRHDGIWVLDHDTSDSAYSGYLASTTLPSAPVSTSSSATCWSGAYTAARCCDLARGPTGDDSCWSGNYVFEFCCPLLSPLSGAMPPEVGSAGVWREHCAAAGGSAVWQPVPTLQLSTGVAAAAGDDSCRYANDGQCDEPQYCAIGTDTSDCIVPPPVLAVPGFNDVVDTAIGGTADLFSGGTGFSLDACRLRCTEEPQCNSFVFSEAMGGYCETWTQTSECGCAAPHMGVTTYFKAILERQCSEAAITARATACEDPYTHCSMPCAEALLAAASQCQQYAAVFTSAVGAGLEEACQAAVDSVLAAAPATVTVESDGLRCHPDYAGEYTLQPLPVNGKAHWTKLGSSIRYIPLLVSSKREFGSMGPRTGNRARHAAVLIRSSDRNSIVAGNIQLDREM